MLNSGLLFADRIPRTTETTTCLCLPGSVAVLGYFTSIWLGGTPRLLWRGVAPRLAVRQNVLTNGGNEGQ